MTDIPSDYQRKIAVLIAQEFHDFPEPMTHRIEPILAAEGVVDPAKLASGAYTTSLQNTILQLEQQLAALRAKVAEGEKRWSHMKQHYPRVAKSISATMRGDSK